MMQGPHGEGRVDACGRQVKLVKSHRLGKSGPCQEAGGGDLETLQGRRTPVPLLAPPKRPEHEATQAGKLMGRRQG